MLTDHNPAGIATAPPGHTRHGSRFNRSSAGRRPSGARLWQTLTHKSACLSCAWGTGNQNGGFRDELGEPLQRCLKLKSVEAIGAELQPAVPREVAAS